MEGKFTPVSDLFIMLTGSEIETRRRVKLTLWAYSYEFMNHSMVDDHKFDEECRKVDLTISTRRPDLDGWWREKFDPSTGMWIHNHPELDILKTQHRRIYNK